MSKALTRGSIEQLRGLLADEDEWTKPVLRDINILCDMALRSLGMPSGEQTVGAAVSTDYTQSVHKREVKQYRLAEEQPSGTVRVPVEPKTPAEAQKRISELQAEIQRLSWIIIGDPSKGIMLAQKDSKC